MFGPVWAKTFAISEIFGPVWAKTGAISEIFGPVWAKTDAISEIFGPVEAKTVGISLLTQLELRLQKEGSCRTALCFQQPITRPSMAR